jgi:hypothetical protein
MQDTGDNMSSVRNWVPIDIFGELLSPSEGISGNEGTVKRQTIYFLKLS